jgi:aryl-alcohol dehydrogenase-like predicted oxidoreductase
MFPTARAHGIGIMADAPMAHGLVTGAFTADTTFLGRNCRSDIQAARTYNAP